jgi:hypothetical protein
MSAAELHALERRLRDNAVERERLMEAMKRNREEKDELETAKKRVEAAIEAAEEERKEAERKEAVQRLRALAERKAAAKAAAAKCDKEESESVKRIAAALVAPKAAGGAGAGAGAPKAAGGAGVSAMPTAEEFIDMTPKELEEVDVFGLTGLADKGMYDRLHASLVKAMSGLKARNEKVINAYYADYRRVGDERKAIGKPGVPTPTQITELKSRHPGFVKYEAQLNRLEAKLGDLVRGKPYEKREKVGDVEEDRAAIHDAVRSVIGKEPEMFFNLRIATSKKDGTRWFFTPIPSHPAASKLEKVKAAVLARPSAGFPVVFKE